MNQLIKQKNDFYIDHIALGVSDTQAGVDYIEKLTGVRAFLPEHHNDGWYKSAALDLGNGAFLEIIGPNPTHTKFHPFKQILTELKEPQLVFWYLGTDQFDAAKSVIHDNGFKLQMYQHIEKQVAAEKIDYEIAIIGKGFFSEQPCLIQWHSVPKKHYKTDASCEIVNFEITCRNAKKLNKLFNKLGIALSAKQGENKMTLSLNTPNGMVHLQGGGVKLKGIGAMVTIAKLFKNHIFD